MAAAGALLLIPAVTNGEPVELGGERVPDIAEAAQASGATVTSDPTTVGANGTTAEDAALSAQVLAMAGNPDLLAYGAGPEVAVPTGALGIPGNMLQAYQQAADALAGPCNMQWSLLASIGRIESNHARGGRADASGRTASPILGPVLNGAGFAAIADTDGGKWDGDAQWDRAVGPMQFIPGTWRGYAADGNGDGQTDPNNIYDAALGSAKYLCSGGMDMSKPQDRAAAVFRYNHSDSYVRTVLVWAEAYAKGVTPVATSPVAAVDTVQKPGPVVHPAVPGPPAPPPTTTPPGTTPPPSTTPPGTTPPPSTTPPPTTTPPPSTTPPPTTTPPPPSTTPPPTSEPCTPPTTTPSTPPTTTPAEDPCAPPASSAPGSTAPTASRTTTAE
ncbi:lytic transglycosylase domain-containing protein [Actinokineospora sp. G85]|uniref:lytic transglycosylase domain-containing protein n=1 Tax=Actinokineospora sp. G85 TaxID=3406626 RepID=UPI003C73A64F